MNKYLFLLIILLFSVELDVFSQSYNSYTESSNSPWKYGFRAGLNYDDVTLQQGSEYKFGWKAGVVAEKRLVYNLYFQPSLSFLNKGYDVSMVGYKEDVNAYLIEAVLSMQLKFGDNFKNRGLFLSLSPYFTYGIGGKTKTENVDNGILYKYDDTFSDNKLRAFDLGFQLGLGYDFNKNIEIGAYYYFGLNNTRNTANYKWRGFQLHFTYFVK